jgi:hypothetical protein
LSSAAARTWEQREPEHTEEKPWPVQKKLHNSKSMREQGNESMQIAESRDAEMIMRANTWIEQRSEQGGKGGAETENLTELNRGTEQYRPESKGTEYWTRSRPVEQDHNRKEESRREQRTFQNKMRLVETETKRSVSIKK